MTQEPHGSEATLEALEELSPRWPRIDRKSAYKVFASRMHLRKENALRWMKSMGDFSSSDVMTKEWTRRRPEHRMRFMTLNVAHGRKWATHQALLKKRTVEKNLFAIASLLRREAPDIVALQEADGPSAWSGNFDHVATLARLGQFDHHYRGRHHPFSETRIPMDTGTALLSRSGLKDPSSERFGFSWRDTKGFVVATIPAKAWGDRDIDVVSVHLEFLSPRLKRRQISAMVEVLQDRGRPLILLGDLNCCEELDPQGLEVLKRRLNLRPFEPRGGQPTFPSSRPVLRLDWILATPEIRFVHHRVLPTPLSDHLAVVADLDLT